MKALSCTFAALAILLSDVMCAVVAYLYRDMLCGIAHDCYSAPAGVAFLYAIPFAAGTKIVIPFFYLLEWHLHFSS